MNSLKKFLGLSFYISTTDQLLLKIETHRNNPSRSQQQEVTTYKKIARQRDQPIEASQPASSIKLTLVDY